VAERARVRRRRCIARDRIADRGAPAGASDRLAPACECGASFGAAEPYAQYALQESPGALPGPAWAVLWVQSAWPLLFLVLTAIALVFPDGRLPSARWRRIAVVAAAGCGGFLLLGFFDPEPFEAPYERVNRPLPALPEAAGVLWPIAVLGVLAGLVAAVMAVRVRFRDARGIERLQMKWLAYTALLVPLTLLICVAGALAAGGAEDDDLFNALFLFMLGAIPASISVAVLRYRLYDVDRIIIGSLVYGVVDVAAGRAYGATTLVLGTALKQHDRQSGTCGRPDGDPHACRVR
jgi:hypothetical protein